MKTIQDCINRFESFRINRQLRQHVWDHGDRACALGAFFGAKHGADASYQNRCTNNILPAWLIRLTPSMFDRQRFADAEAWATRVYGRDGLVDRASLLDKGQRETMWKRATILADLEARTNDCIKNAVGGNRGTFNQAWNYVEKGTDTTAKLCGTLLDCIDQALTEAGV